MRRVFALRAVPVLLGIGLAGAALAASAQGSIPIPSLNVGIGEGQGPDDLSSSLKILALLTILSLAPAILILTTAFTRIVIVLSLLRTAMGTQNIPPTQIIVGLSLFLTFYVMSPTYGEINDTALKPYMNKEITYEQAFENAQQPLREFMLKNTYEKDLQLFLDMREERPESRDEVSLVALIPAFVISELKTAFIIGFYLFIPFIIIDLVVASVLMSMGMMMMPPVVVSLPAKLLVFILADGWTVLVGALMSGFN